MNVSAIVLAAGSARRFGAQKMLAEFDGAPLVRWAVLAVARSLASEVIVVAGAEADGVQAALDGLPVHIVANERHAEGMSSSLTCGLDSVDPAADAALVALGDQPRVHVDVVNALIARFDGGGARIVQPSYRGEPSHPVLFSRDLFDELRAIRGDRGARGVLERHASEIVFVEIDAPVPQDVDTPEDLDRL